MDKPENVTVVSGLTWALAVDLARTRNSYTLAVYGALANNRLMSGWYEDESGQKYLSIQGEMVFPVPEGYSTGSLPEIKPNQRIATFAEQLTYMKRVNNLNEGEVAE